MSGFSPQNEIFPLCQPPLFQIQGNVESLVVNISVAIVQVSTRLGYLKDPVLRPCLNFHEPCTHGKDGTNNKCCAEQ